MCAKGKRARNLRNLLHNVGGTYPWRSPQRPRHIMRAARVPPPTRMSAISPSEYSSKDFIGSKEERKKWHSHLSHHSHLQSTLHGTLRRFSTSVSKSKCLGVWIFSSIFSLLLSRFIHTTTCSALLCLLVHTPLFPLSFIVASMSWRSFTCKKVFIFASSDDLICWQTWNCKFVWLFQFSLSVPVSRRYNIRQQQWH